MNDICKNNVITEDSVVQQLKSRYESNVFYTRISDGVLVSLANNFSCQDSFDYVTEYKNTSLTTNTILPTHLFQMINQVYLHMRRTGIDQSILLSGDTGSGKSETNNMIISHLISLGKKESKVTTQILHLQTILNAFGHCNNQSKFGKYMELQFNERGRMTGCKILNYLLDKKRVLMTRNNFNIFNIVNNGNLTEEYESLKVSLRHLGLGKRYHTRITQLITTLTQLLQLQFIDDTTMQQESAYVKNIELLEVIADGLGVDTRSLENVLTYKTQLIKKDVTTLILNAEQASTQRDDLIVTLYSLLFNWLIEHINQKLCNETIHNFIGILDLPATEIQQQQQHNFDKFCLNYTNERVQNYIQKYLFETINSEYQLDGFNLDVTSYNNSCIDLFDQPRNGFIDIINSFSKKSSKVSDNTMLETTFKYQNGNDSFQLKKADTGSNYFMIQHFNGYQSYQPNGFIESNRDPLNVDFISLFKGSSDIAASSNTFIVNLFADKSITTELHPKFNDSILNAQQLNKPNRSPSMRRSKSTKKNRNSTTNDSPEKNTKKIIPVVLSQLRSSLDELFSTLDETMPWFVFCLKAAKSNNSITFDSNLVRSQLESFNLISIASSLKIGSFANIFLHLEFVDRYHDILSSINIDPDRLPKDKCQAAIDILGWSTTMDAALGHSKIFLSDTAWRHLEDTLRAVEKQDQRKQKDTLLSRDISHDALSHASSGSNADLNSSEYMTQDRRAMAAANAAAAGLPIPRAFTSNTRMSTYSEDQLSFVSEDQGHNDTDSQTASEHYDSNASGYLEMKTMPVTVVEESEPEEEYKMSGVRKRWLFFVYLLTWWVPTPFMIYCGRMKRKDIQIAWREKLTLCMVIFFMSAFIIWFLVFFGKLICPHQDVFSQSELQAHSTSGNAYVAIRGEVFDLTKFAPHHWANQVIPTGAITAYAGKDASDLFPVQVSALCQGVTGTVSDYVSLDYHFNLTDANSNYHDFRAWTDDPRPDWYFEKMVYLRKNYKIGTMGYTDKDVYRQATTPVDMSGVPNIRVWAVLNSSIYDLTYYVSGGRRVELPTGMNASAADGVDVDYMSDAVVNLFRQKSGEDITDYWNALPLDPEIRQRQEVCLRNLFYVGSLDQRNSPQCIFSEYLLLIVTVFLCLVIVFKFMAALQFTTKREPQNHDKFVICQVPCYTEGEEELKKTIDSIAALHYDDKRKLLFIICDGMIVGGGNDRPTPRIVLDILGVDPHVDPEPLSFLSVGEGQKQHNMAKIYSGLYECQGHVVPYIVVSKVGRPSERQKPGNRGKRDSQLILMRFLNKVHFNAPMTPMELEVYHQIKNVIGVNPSFYEFVLMVDADTEVISDGLNRLVSSFVHDAKVIGLCGETKLSNEKDTWVTMIQVYEYFISHYMIKAFESLFGSVTCLPGCFCMYRVRSPTKNQPLLVSNQVIEDYQINRVDTLHKKNLLHLGEDRYLTTLILKHFPTYKTKFVPDAKCATNAPDQWSILLSQRRRWINSTIHNLGELVFLPQLCGFCCFSMRFVVMLDLISTLVQPAIVGYLCYLIYTLATSSSAVPVMSIITIAGVYGLQAIIFILHKKWEHIIWMIVSIFAIPVFSLYIPIYSYWHFDDFSWGNTRVVLGDKGKKLVVGADEGKFDPKSIPTMSWEKYEEALYSEDWNKNDDTASVGSKGSAYTHSSYVSYGSYGSKQPPQPVAYPASQFSYNQMVPSQSMGTLPIQNSHSSVFLNNSNPHLSMVSGMNNIPNNPHQSMMSGYNNSPYAAYNINHSSPLHRYE
ncbi:chitin synthase-domain-containing protein [Thamnidium elegans]|nr:chitin synthase-domain-containing protein [Thamnidium elegans]